MNLVREVIYEGRFKRDLKLLKKRGKTLTKLFDLAELLRDDIPLAFKHRPHLLSGDWAGYWECHIEPDWLLIYRIEYNTLYLARTGTHSDLF